MIYTFHCNFESIQVNLFKHLLKAEAFACMSADGQCCAFSFCIFFIYINHTHNTSSAGFFFVFVSLKQIKQLQTFL